VAEQQQPRPAALPGPRDIGPRAALRQIELDDVPGHLPPDLRSAVGWVEQCETHLLSTSGAMGFAALNPSYGRLPRFAGNDSERMGCHCEERSGATTQSRSAREILPARPQ